MLPVLILVLAVLLLAPGQQAPPPSGAGAYYGPPSPGVQYFPPPAAAGGPSTRTQIETGVGAIGGAAVGAYACGGAPSCIALGAGLGGAVGPVASRGGEFVGRKVASGATSAYNATLGKLF